MAPEGVQRADDRGGRGGAEQDPGQRVRRVGRRVGEQRRNAQRAGPGEHRVDDRLRQQQRALPQIPPLALVEQERGVARQQRAGRHHRPRQDVTQTVGPQQRGHRERERDDRRDVDALHPSASHDRHCGRVNRKIARWGCLRSDTSNSPVTAIPASARSPGTTSPSADSSTPTASSSTASIIAPAAMPFDRK
ncbi:MAG: hypothetical protein R2736_21395 [Solirubrobacterales bacterium]